MGEEKVEKRDSVSIVAGVFSLLFILIEVVGAVMVLREGRFPVGLLDIFIFLYSAYVFDKTIYEGKNLTAWEIAIFVIVALIAIFFVSVGFMIGFYSVI